MFKPHYKMTNELVDSLLTLETLRKEIELLPISVSVLNSLRETSRMESIHYSTMIEGNRLTLEQVKEVLLDDKIEVEKRIDKLLARLTDHDWEKIAKTYNAKTWQLPTREAKMMEEVYERAV